jgi:hypothetical protein
MEAFLACKRHAVIAARKFSLLQGLGGKPV